ncbi:hypothetical protein ACP70R_039579 [Stipagrostis hirtigluma subsp. patula]
MRRALIGVRENALEEASAYASAPQGAHRGGCPCLELLLEYVDLRVVITIADTPKLTTLGYLVVGFQYIVLDDESAHVVE